MIIGQVTELEYIAAHTLHRGKVQSLVKQVALIVFISGSVLFFAFSRRLGVILICATLGGLLGELIQSRFFLPSKLRRLYAQVRGRVDVTYSWNEENLFLTSEHGQVTRSWSDFLKAKENDEVILLYFNDALYEIIPKRWFLGANNLHTFRTHLKFVS